MDKAWAGIPESLNVRAVALCLAVVTSLAVLTTTRAQEASGSQASIRALEVEGGVVAAIVSVTDDGGTPLSGLDPDAFSISVGGIPVTPASVGTATAEQLPLGVVIAVDVSGSMAGAPLDAARSAIGELVSAREPGDGVTIITFASEVAVLVPHTTDRGALLAALDGLAASGDTALFAATVAATEAAAELAEPRRAIVLLSDGEDFGTASGEVNREAALAAADQAGIPAFVVGLGVDVDAAFLREFGASSGGRYFAAADAAQLEGLYTLISEQLRLEYVVRFAVPEGLEPGSSPVVIDVAGATAEGSIDIPARPVTLVGLPRELAVATTIQLRGTAGASHAVELDGTDLASNGDGAFRLDPWALAPGEHSVIVKDRDGEVVAQATFEVPPLSPRVTAVPAEGELEPGELLTITVEAQPGPVSVTYLVAGVEVERHDEAPFEFTIPRGPLAAGRHSFEIVVETVGGRAELSRSIVVQASPDDDDTSSIAPLSLALLTVGAVVALGVGGFLMRRALNLRTSGGEAEGPDTLVGSPPPESAESGPVAAEVWGSLEIVEGRDRGRRFTLRDDPELIGRGRFCSVRLRDRRVERAHVVLNRDATFVVSTPTCRLEVDGLETRSGMLETGAMLRLGETLLRLELFDGPHKV